MDLRQAEGVSCLKIRVSPGKLRVFVLTHLQSLRILRENLKAPGRAV